MKHRKTSATPGGISRSRSSKTRAQRKNDRFIERLLDACIFPIVRSFEYATVGRKLIMVDELPQGALARYERVGKVHFIASSESQANKGE